MKRTLATITITAAALALGACSNSDAADAAAPAAQPVTSSAAAAEAAECAAAHPIEDSAFAAAVATVPLPAGGSVTAGRVSTDSDEPGMIALAIDVCVPGVDGADALRPLATQYAKAIKASPLADTVFALYVANYQNPQMTGGAKIKDPDFKLHLWNGNPSPSAELKNWVVVTG